MRRTVSTWAICAAIAVLFVSSGCRRAQQTKTVFRGVSPGFHVKGTYYFQPKAAINSFWSWVDFDRTKDDFQQLRDDGFNTIILMIPWGLFQPEMQPIKYNQTAFDTLHRIINLADAHGLKVILRVGTHEYIPRGAAGARWLAATVLSNDDEWAAYRDLFREVAAQVRQHSNVLAVFWTFEDTGYSPDLWLHQYPQNLKAYRTWLRTQPLEFWNQQWQEQNASYDTIEPPDQNHQPQNESKLRSFAQFADSLVVRRLPDICAAVRAGNPDLLISYQPRPEINWGYDYSAQYRLPGCYSYVTTWFSPYQSYLFGEVQNGLDARRVASYVPLHLQRTRQLAKGLPVFVDQFNFRHFGGPAGESALGGEKEELEFVSRALPPLVDDALGYCVWNYTDYYLNTTYNGSFRFGLEDWDVSEPPHRVQLRDSEPAGHHSVEIHPGGWIRQKISVGENQELTLEFEAQAPSPGQTIEVRVNYLSTQQHVEFSFPVTDQRKSYQQKIKSPAGENALTVTFAPGEADSPVTVGHVMLYPWIDTGGLYTVERQPRAAIRDVFRKFNLAHGSDN